MNNVVAGQEELSFSGYRRLFTSTICQVDCDPVGNQHAFSARFESVPVGEIEVFRFEGTSVRRAERSQSVINSYPSDHFLMLMPLTLSFEIAHNGRHTLVEPGSFTFFDTEKPFEGVCGKRAGQIYRGFNLKIPKTLMRQQIPHADKLCAQAIKADDGIGSVMQDMIFSVHSHGQSLLPDQRHALGAMLLNTIGMVVIGDRESIALSDTARENVYARVRLEAERFIQAHLADPNLECGTIAKSCRVSVRYLHTVFEASTTTVAGYIRSQRLERCRAELVSKDMCRKSIFQIAMKWGYINASSFNRAYRARFGIAPSDDRAKALALLRTPSQ